jgi:valacyclovir hydrolase
MPFQRANDVDFFYEDEGSGQPVLLLHGAFGTGRGVFDGMIDYIADSGYRVIAPDMRGYGRSRPPERDYPLDFYRRDAGDMAALARALGIAGAHVVGISDGGIIGLLLAVEHPWLLSSLVAWAANADFPADERPLYENILDAGNSLHFLQAMRERHGMSAGEARRMLASFVSASLAITDHGHDVGLGERLARIRCPVLVGAGKLGDFLPLRHAELQLRLIPHAELWIVPRVGHFWPMTDEGRPVFVARLLDWFEQHTRPGVEV